MAGDLTGCFLGYDPGGDGKHGVAAITIGSSGRVEDVVCRTRKTAHDVLTWFLDRIAEKEIECVERGTRALGPVRGLGVDTLTYWSSGKSGLRRADVALRTEYDESLKKLSEKRFTTSVVAPNGLYGSMSINGMLVLRKLRSVYPCLYVTETHPKVLYFALTAKRTKYDYPSEPAKKRDESEVDFQTRRNRFNDRRREMSRWLAKKIGLPRTAPDDRKPQTRNSHEWDALISAWAAFQAKSGAWKTDLVRLDTKTSREGLDFPAGCVAYGWPHPIEDSSKHDMS